MNPPNFIIIKHKFSYLIALVLFLLVHIQMKAQAVTSPQVPFSQRTSVATPAKAIYNIKGDFTMLGNTNLTLVSYGDNINNEGKLMKYVDIDGDPSTLNSSMATLELSNSGENDADQDCSKVVFAGLYWTGKSDDKNETFSITKNSVTKNYIKKEVSLKGPGAASYTTITAKGNSEIRFPRAKQSGIFIGYQEITEYVKIHGPGAYTVADIALIEGTNGSPGLSGGWVMVVIYENPLLKSRAITLFDGYAYVNGQRSGGGEYGNIDISGFTTVDTGPVNMKLGVMAAEGDVDVASNRNDYLAVQKLTADPNKIYDEFNYLTLNHAGNTTNNFFNSSIFPVPAAGESNPNLKNNTGFDFSMFTIPNAGNLVIGNKQTATTFRFGSNYDIYTIFGFAMSVDAYVPEPKGLISVTSINNVTNPTILNALPGQTINYSLDITNEGTEAINNTIISIPIPETAIFNMGSSIVFNTYHGFSTNNVPYFDEENNEIIWDLGTLPITPGHPEYVYADLSFDLDVTEDCDIILSAGCSPEVSLETGTITGTGDISKSSFTKNFFQGYDTSPCHLPIDGSIKVAIDDSSCFSSMAGSDQITSCGGESVILSATVGTTGYWTIISGPSGGGEVFSDSTNPTSEFTSPNLGEYNLRWTTVCGTSDEVLITFELCDVVNFDGIDDHINLKDNYNLDIGSFSIETWVKSNALNALNGSVQTIMSKRSSPSSTVGYDLRLVNNTISFNWNNGQSIASSHPIDQNRWYHIAVTFNGSEYNLYIDGILVKGSVSGSNPTLNIGVNCIVGTMDQNQNSPQLENCFNGWMDELRIWNVALTIEQIRQMMNQEIEMNGTAVKGKVVPLNISGGLLWTDLAGYYQMNSATDILNGYVLDKSTSAIHGRLRNIYSSQEETAPLPYTSIVDGQDWSNDTTWTHFDVWDAPNSIGIDNSTSIDWNIVQTSHNITSGDKNITVLGLISTSGTLTIADPIITSPIENNAGRSLTVTHYLELDGDIDLVGESQLIQTKGSILDQDSGGYIKRDQQGTANSYNYNYWSSSVGPITTEGLGQRGTGVASTNGPFTLAGVLMDGTDANNPNKKGVIQFLTPYAAADSGITSPIIISTYWLNTFNADNNYYSSWHPFDQNTDLLAGEGYTMKGTSGAVSITDNQNYVFKGKPYNGDVTLPIAKNGQGNRLIGNPYPSAIDAKEFIKDNIKDGGSNTEGNIFNGALYFWDHFGEMNSHYLKQYVGGYASYTLMGGTKAIANDARINTTSGLSTTKEPGPYIPVGQGFYVRATLDPLLNGTTITVDGGDIIFKNSQRIFKTETPSTSVFMKGVSSKAASTGENEDKLDKRAKIWLQFDSPTGYHRQLLVGVDENTSNNFDLGYDAPIIDIAKEDVYWAFSGGKFVIQGVNNFNNEQELPLGLIINKTGIARIKIDKTENLNKNLFIYIKDKLTGKIVDITKNTFEIELNAGEYANRFALTFKTILIPDKNATLIDEDVLVMITNPLIAENVSKEQNEQPLNTGIYVFMDNSISELQINNTTDTEILSVKLFNNAGQLMNSWKSNLNKRDISLPIHKATGIYNVQITTKNGTTVKKIMVE